MPTTATPMRIDQITGSADYRSRLRSYHQTTVRRSPRFHPRTNPTNQPQSTAKPSSSNNKTHLEKSPQISQSRTRIPNHNKTQQGCPMKCPSEREPLRSVENLNGFVGSSHGKPLRRSPRLSVVNSAVLSGKGSGLSSQLNKENVRASGLNDEMGSGSLSVREAKEEKSGGDKMNGGDGLKDKENVRKAKVGKFQEKEKLMVDLTVDYVEKTDVNLRVRMAKGGKFMEKETLWVVGLSAEKGRKMKFAGKKKVGLKDSFANKDNVGVDGLNDDVGSGSLGVKEAKEGRFQKVNEVMSDRLMANVETDDADRSKREAELQGNKKLGIDGNMDNPEKGEEGRDWHLNMDKKRKTEVSCEEEKIACKKVNTSECNGLGDWTEEQDAALQKAYLIAKPSPHFWKKVAKMVPEKSAQECFDRVNGSYDTPPQPRSRAKKSMLSPIGRFSLSDGKPIDRPVPLVKKLNSRRKTLVAQKTVRHLLKKHCNSDLTQEADHFLNFETSPITLGMDLAESSSPETPNSASASFLQKCSGGVLAAHQKMLSRFKPLAQANQPSPDVLKRVKNVVLHEKYINQLHSRDARRKSVAPGVGKNECDQNNGVLKAAKTALMSDAKEFISQFQRLRALSQAGINTDDEDEEVDDDDDEHDDDDDE